MPPYQPKSTPLEINKKLINIKKSITNKQFHFLKTRKKNMDTLAALGWNTSNVLDVILELTYKNYLYGPTDDRGFPEDANTIWEFGYELENNSIYIKIKIKQLDDIIGLSFHIAEKPLHYHYK